MPYTIFPHREDLKLKIRYAVKEDDGSIHIKECDYDDISLLEEEKTVPCVRKIKHQLRKYKSSDKWFFNWTISNELYRALFEYKNKTYFVLPEGNIIQNYILDLQ